MRHLLSALAICLALPALANEPVDAFPGGVSDEAVLTARQRLLDAAGPQEILLHASCCKVCSKGKACGDSCISQDRQCTRGGGCACDG